MIKNYSHIIKDLIGSITGKNSEFTWTDFMYLMKDSVILVLFFALCITLGYALFYKIPKVAADALMKKPNAEIKRYDENKELTYDVYLNAKSMKKRRTTALILCGIFGYLPIVTPFVLMVINVVF